MQSQKTGAFRHWVQAAWFALTNGHAAGYLQGRIFTGKSKALCVPGLNCYSCPGALYACPIGSLQAVLDSGSFKVSCYVFGMLMAFGALRWGPLAASVVLIVLGVMQGEVATIFNKATNICLECIGIG